ncbi:MAG: hypothetical protein LBS97_06505 [Treponema sp.]|jgi:hypothetical protein|nr:hypothetical protein [Treponema sp.]
MSHIKRFCCILIICGVSFFAPLEAELFFGGGFAFDLPEGYTQVAASGDNTLVSFVHSTMPVQLALRIFPKHTGFEPNTALQDVFSRLNASGNTTEIQWRDSPCILSTFSMQPQGGARASGWALAVRLPQSKPEGAILVALAYTDVQLAGGVTQQLIISTLDSLYIDDESWYESGPITTFAYPEAAPEKISLNIAGQRIQTEINSADAEGAQSVVEREFTVLSQYGASPLFREAWQRYYRQIFRDSCARLKRPAQDILAAFQSKPPAERLITLLSWVQQFPYERNFDTSDFTSLPAVLAGQGSDCDSRAMLLAVILRFMDINTVLFISDAYRHAILGVELNLKGAKIPVHNEGTVVHYLVAETTAPVAPGLIAENMSDPAKWFPVIFPR